MWLVVILAAFAASSPAPAVFDVLFALQFNSPHPPASTAVQLRVTRAWAPIGVDHFWTLVQAGYYNANGFFRLVPAFVTQWGINGSPAVSARWNNVTLKDDPVVQSNVRGTISYATAGPNTRTTQLFLNLADNAFLDSEGFAPFAEVTHGMDVVDQIFAGYGQNPDQEKIYAQGNAYLKAQFPLLTYIAQATIVQ